MGDRPTLTDVITAGDPRADEVLRLAASLDQAVRAPPSAVRGYAAAGGS